MAQPDTTALTPAEEQSYRQWLNASAITDAAEPDAHYDYRGLFRELKGKVVPTSTNRHFPDTYKQHGHPTFSVESKYSKGANDGGRWEGDKYVAQSAEVVIVDDAGTEHVFPPGFDPKRAAAIVGGQGGAKAPTENLDKLATMLQTSARGRPAGSSVIDEGPASPLLEMLGPFAHPQTLTDFGHLLGVRVDHVRRAMTEAMAMAAARGPASTALSATGRGVESMGSGLEKASGNVGLADALFNQKPVRGVAIAVAPKVIKFAGRGLQRAGSALAPAVGEAAPVASAAAEVAPAAAQGATNTLPNQKLLNELAIEARRAKVRLTAEAEQAAIEAVRKGATPAEAVATVAPARAAAPAATAAVKGQLSAAEAKEVDRLIRSGKTDAQARALIEIQRELIPKLGTPTPTAAETRFPKGFRGKGE